MATQKLPNMTAGRAALIGLVDRYLKGLLDPYISLLEVHKLITSMKCGDASEALKKGQKVSREGWNGKGMFLYYVPANKYPATRNANGPVSGIADDDGMVSYGAYIAMKTVSGICVPWLASQTDVLAEDWRLVES